MCSCGGSQPQNPSGGNTGTGGSSKAECKACTVTLSPKNEKICGAGNTKDVTATGSPAGGTYSWSSSDSSVASVAGSGNKGTITGKAQGTAVITVTYNVAGCTPCTDTVTVKVCTCTPGRKYAYGLKSKAKLIGVKAKIKTRYGKICCENEGCSTDTGYHVVYANISNNTGTMIWAQAGYGRERNAGSAAIKSYRYAEMNGSTYKVNYDTANAPAEGSSHVYQCDLNKATGKWSFSYDGTVWKNFADGAWRGKTGTDLQYTGEIYNKEDDMPGTAGSKCSFTECQYRVEGKAYTDAGLVAGNVKSDDAAQWGAEHVSGTALNIWDKKPIT